MKLVRGNETISAHECACASADCVPLKSCKQLILFAFEMYGKQGFKAVHKTLNLVKLIGKGCSFFFFECLYQATYDINRTTTEQT